MAQVSRKLKLEDDDLISKLPDEILTHILSFFPTKFAVATCVLSKRWKLLWISVPNLEFDFVPNLGFNFFNRLSNSTTYKGRKVPFEKLVDRVLSLNNVMYVRNVKLDCSIPDVLRANAWFKSLVTRSAEKFAICFPRSFLVKGSLSSSSNLNFLPDSFFNQKNLVELKLSDFVLKVPPLVCFPCLKTIKLQQVRFLEEESMKNLLSGCPILTSLCIRMGKCLNKLTLCICSSTLQKLNLYIYHGKGSDSKLVINAPKLAFLSLEEVKGAATYDMINISSLVSASLSYVTEAKPIFELLRKISHVKKLFLDRFIWRIFENASLQKLPMFYSLIHLTLEIQRKENLDVWPRLLEYIPNVVNIVLKPRKQCHWLLNVQLDLPQSILSSIESIEITNEIGQPMPVITCIIRNATALKKLSFHGLPICYVQRHSFLKSFLTD